MTETHAKRARFARPVAERRRDPTTADRLEAAGLAAVGALLRLLGPDAASAAMGRAWRRLAPLNRRHARADDHLRLAMPELGSRERRAILLDMWENLGRTAAETFLLDRIVADPGRFEYTVGDLDLGGDARRGAIFASLHMGNWEFAGWGIRLAGFEVAAVYQPLKNPLADDRLRAMREPLYDAGLLPRDTATAFRLRTLARRGVAVGMLADLRDATGIEVDFFGRPALANVLPATLARRLDLPLVAGRVVRTRGARFRIEATRLAVPRSDDAAADIAAGTRALTACYEAWIRETPGQWMWAHRKWRQED